MSASRPVTSTGTFRLSAGLSTHPEATRAARAAAAQVGERLDAPADLVFLFLSSHHLREAEAVTRIVREELRPTCLVGVSASGVLGGISTPERASGVSVLAARLPGTVIVPFTSDDLLPYVGDSPQDVVRFGRVFGASEDLRAVFVFVDPFSVPLAGILAGMCRARAGERIGTILGGFASGGTAPGSNAMVLDDMVRTEGAVGVSLRGSVRVDTLVSQGCLGFGPNLVITACRRNVIQSLSGRRALDVLRECVEALPEPQRAQAHRAPLIGRAVTEDRERLGRGDYLVRNILGVDEATGAIAVADFLRVGQTVRFHVLDSVTAESDLAMLLDGQRLHDAPLGALLLSSTSRNADLFGCPWHDAAMVARAFAPTLAGELRAKAGYLLSPDTSPIPLAGFYSSAEIGPAGDGRDSYVHGHAACLAVFRPPVV